jgi:chromosome segregation ATPase
MTQRITKNWFCRKHVLCLALVIAAFGGAAEVAEGWTRQQVVEQLGAPNFAVGSGERETLGYGARRIVLVDGVVVDPGEPEEGVAEPESNAGEADEAPQRETRLTEQDIKLQRAKDELALLTDKMQGLSRDIRSAEQEAIRIRNRSLGLAPQVPRLQSGRMWEQYKKDEEVYQAKVKEKEEALATAEKKLEELEAQLGKLQDESARQEIRIREMTSLRDQELAGQSQVGSRVQETVDRLKETVGIQTDALDEEEVAGRLPVGWMIGLGVALAVLLGLGFMVRMQRG